MSKLRFQPVELAPQDLASLPKGITQALKSNQGKYSLYYKESRSPIIPNVWLLYKDGVELSKNKSKDTIISVAIMDWRKTQEVTMQADKNQLSLF